MKLNFIFWIIFISLYTAEAKSEHLMVLTHISGQTNKLNKSEAGHIFGNIAGFLSTCAHYERIVGKEYDLNKTKKALNLIKSNDHIEVSFKAGVVNLPIGYQNDTIEKIYVGFSEKNHLPRIMTIYEDQPQSYAKCMGDLSILNFRCDRIISPLFALDSNHKFCEDANKVLHRTNQ